MRLLLVLSLLLLLVSLGCVSNSPVPQEIKEDVANGSASAGLNTSLFVPQPENKTAIIAIPPAQSDILNSSFPVVEYYYSSSCSACKEIAPLIAQVQKDFSSNITIIGFDVSTGDGFKQYNKFAAINNIPSNARYIPAIKIGNKILTGTWGINQSGIYEEIYNLLSNHTTVQ
ncbi:MAG: thioredoxin domain-containing protein [Candidatus Micrarchaeia archaeon]|jgi:thiol-disulfide isomerase/thioredoxin